MGMAFRRATLAQGGRTKAIKIKRPLKVVVISIFPWEFSF